MTGLATRNAHGVYTDREVIALASPKRGHAPLAEIRVAHTPDGWRSSFAFSFSTGSWWGHTSPITDRDPPFADRQGAMDHAGKALAAYLTRRQLDPEMQRELAAILAWLETLNPTQRDLFAA